MIFEKLFKEICDVQVEVRRIARKIPSLAIYIAESTYREMMLEIGRAHV